MSKLQPGEPVELPPRLFKADARVVLERLAATDLIERGSVTLLSVEAIRERAGDRWPRKRDDVCAYMERKLDEHLSFRDIAHQVGETDFLVAVTAEEGVAAQSIALKILEEVLIHFLGAAEKVDLNLRAVKGIDGLAVRSVPVDLTKLIGARVAPSVRELERGIDPEEARKRNPVFFTTVAGERVRVEFTLEPVVNLRHQVTAALRIRRRVSSLETGRPIRRQQFHQLEDDDVAFVDRATLAYAGLFADRLLAGQPGLIVPTAFRTVAGRKGRAALLGLPGLPPDIVRRHLIVELADVGAGTPHGRLVEVVGLLGQLSRAVFATVEASRDTLAALRQARLKGLAFDVAELTHSDKDVGLLMTGMGQQMRGLAPCIMASGLPDASWLAAARDAGFTHATLRSERAADAAA